MRGSEAADWLKPMLDEARKRNIDFTPLFHSASIPAAEADVPALKIFVTKPDEFVTGRITDWVQDIFVLVVEDGVYVEASRDVVPVGLRDAAVVLLKLGVEVGVGHSDPSLSGWVDGGVLAVARRSHA